MENYINLELNQEHLEYILVGLELYCMNLNSIFAISNSDSEMRNEKYNNIFYLYHRLLNLSTNYETYSRLQKPKRKYKKKKK